MKLRNSQLKFLLQQPAIQPYVKRANLAFWLSQKPTYRTFFVECLLHGQHPGFFNSPEFQKKYGVTVSQNNLTDCARRIEQSAGAFFENVKNEANKKEHFWFVNWRAFAAFVNYGAAVESVPLANSYYKVFCVLLYFYVEAEKETSIRSIEELKQKLCEFFANPNNVFNFNPLFIREITGFDIDVMKQAKKDAIVLADAGISNELAGIGKQENTLKQQKKEFVKYLAPIFAKEKKDVQDDAKFKQLLSEGKTIEETLSDSNGKTFRVTVSGEKGD
jgi:hypothetical protein